MFKKLWFKNKLYLSFFIQITFIAEYHFFHISTGIFFNVSNPILYVFKAFFICNIIDQHNAHRTSVVSGRYSTEPLLSCSVPEQETCKFWKTINTKLLLLKKSYHICSLTFLPSRSIVRILKSIPENKSPIYLTIH